MDNGKRKIKAIGRFSKYFLDQFSLTILVILMMIGIGVIGYISLPKESLPEIVFPSITIQTAYPGASVEDVEYAVTDKIENQIYEIDDVESITSQTQYGLSVVNVEFNESVDINQKKLELDNLLGSIQFTEGVLPSQSFIFSTSEIPLMEISIAGNYTIDELTQIAEAIKLQIEKIPGVDEAKISGDAEKEIELTVSEVDMMKYGISFGEIRNVFLSQNVSAPIANLDLNGSQFTLRVDERLDSIDDIKKLVVRDNIYLEDIAEVELGIKSSNSYSRTYVRGQNDEALPSVVLTITRKVNSDVIGTSDNIRTLVKDEKGLLYPNDITLEISNDLAVNVSNDLSRIQKSAWSGLIVVIVVLFLFIGFKESLIVAITIPLSLLGTLGILNLMGITFNTFVILGLIVALGLLVDNSIIVMENIDRLKKEKMSAYDASLYGIDQVGKPIVSSTFTTVAAFFPLAILPGILGAFISTIPITIIITLIVSLTVSLIVTPSISNKVLAFKERSFPKYFEAIFSTGIVLVLTFYAFNGITPWITYSITIVFALWMLLKTLRTSDGETQLVKYYSRMIYWIIQKKRRSFTVLFIGFLSLGLSIFMIVNGTLKISFFPNGEPTSLSINIDTNGGMTLDKTNEIVKKYEDILVNTEGVSQFNTTIGGFEIDSGKIVAELDTTNRSGFEIRNEVTDAFAEIPGAIVTIDSIVAGPPVGKPIEIQVYGNDIENIYEYVNHIKDNLLKIEGVYNVELSTTEGVPQMIIDLSALKNSTYNTSSGQIANQLRAEINGIKVSSMKMNQETVDIIVRKDSNMINDVEMIKNLFIASSDGNMLILKDLADFRVESGLSSINHIDGTRVITVFADLFEGYNTTEVIDILKENLDIPSEGITVKYSGDIAGISQNFGSLFQSMLLAVFLIFVILTIQFKSIKQPFIILTTIPMALIGVIWGLIITGNDFGFYAFMGLVALAGIAVNDAIVLMDFTNYLRREGKSLFEAIKEAGKVRFSPVLATTLTTIGGVMPLAFREVYYAQFSFALIFGLLMTTILTLIFIPILYSLFNFRQREKVD
jgi:HAE1 family hydrophobic/amphiphilic exporter-1